MSDILTVLIINPDSEQTDRYAEWLDDVYTVRTAPDAETALWHFDESVDFVLLNRKLPDMSGEELLGQLKESATECRFILQTDDDPGFEILKLDIDEYVRTPLDREQLRAIFDRLEDRIAVEDSIGAYLDALSKKRTLEAGFNSDEIESDPRYQSLQSELLTRRRQIDSLLTRLSGSQQAVPDILVDSETDQPPVYKQRSGEFYGLWLLAALTYGVGDILSTVYAVFMIPGIEEANPIVDVLLANFGIGGFLLFKLLVFLVLITISVQGGRTDDQFSYYWPPLLATVLGTGLTLWNLSLIV